MTVAVDVHSDQDARYLARIDRFELEDAIMDAEGDSLLLDLALDAVIVPDKLGTAWRVANMEPLPGYRLLLLAEEQVRAIDHACSNLLFSVRRVVKAYHGPENA